MIISAPHPQFKYHPHDQFAWPPRNTERQATLSARAKLSSLFWRLDLALNLMASIVIIGRLLWLRRESKVFTQAPVQFHESRPVWSHLTGKLISSLSFTSGLTAMLIESSLLYTAVLMLSAALRVKEGSFTLLPPLITQIEAIAAELMILHHDLALGSSAGAQIDVELGDSLPDERADTSCQAPETPEGTSVPADKDAQPHEARVGKVDNLSTTVPTL